MVKDLLGLAHQYAFPELEQAVSDYLKSILSLSNVCLVYDVANLYQLRSLMEACRQFADRQAAEILQSEAFLQLSPVSILFNFRFKPKIYISSLSNREPCAIYSGAIHSALPK